MRADWFHRFFQLPTLPVFHVRFLNSETTSQRAQADCRNGQRCRKGPLAGSEGQLPTNDEGFAYDGRVYAAAVLTLGRNTRPEILPALSNANWMSMVVRSNSHGVMTISLSSILLTRGSALQLLYAPA